jgi:endonuclease-3 related protein
MDVETAYDKLLEEHGRQGWWPLLTRRDEEGYDDSGYHPGIYDYTDTDQHRFEVYAGSILTQNTRWENANKALKGLLREDLLSPTSILDEDQEQIQQVIKPARYYNQKTTYLKSLAYCFQTTTHPTRNKLLDTKGVGPETADTILLYAQDEPRIIADEYTRRWLNQTNVSLSSYDNIKKFLDERFPRNTRKRQELHALIIAHQKDETDSA